MIRRVRPQRLPRRAFLRGAAGTMIALPWLQAMTPRPARGAPGGLGPIPRFIVFYTPNGHPLSQFRAPAGAVNPMATPILTPLTKLRDRMLVLEGIGLLSAERLGHECIGSLLTGTRPGGGRSLDQHMVDLLGQTRLGSLELGVSVPAAPPSRVHLSFTGANSPRPAINDPRVVFDKIFPGDGSGPPSALLVSRRRSVLDGIKSHLQRTLPLVSTTDRPILQQHLESVREVEQGLERVLPLGCARPTRPAPLDLTNHANADALTNLQSSLLGMAMACDATRVATFMLAEAGAERYFSFLGVNTNDPKKSWVGLSHQSDETSQTTQGIISRWCAERLGQLVDRLLSVQEGSGTALDRTLILWATECNPDHRVDDVPMVLLAGSGIGGITTRRVARFPDRTSHNDLLLSLLGLMGGRSNSFGNPAYSTGPLSLT